MFHFKHEYLRSRASRYLSLSSSFSSVTVSQLWTLSRYSCLYLGSRIQDFFFAIEFKIFCVENISKLLVSIFHYLEMFVFLEQNKHIAWSVSSMYTSLYFIHIQATLVYKSLLSDNSYKSFKKLSNIFLFFGWYPSSSSTYSRFL